MYANWNDKLSEKDNRELSKTLNLEYVARHNGIHPSEKAELNRLIVNLTIGELVMRSSAFSTDNNSYKKILENLPNVLQRDLRLLTKVCACVSKGFLDPEIMGEQLEVAKDYLNGKEVTLPNGSEVFLKILKGTPEKLIISDDDWDELLVSQSNLLKEKKYIQRIDASHLKEFLNTRKAASNLIKVFYLLFDSLSEEEVRKHRDELDEKFSQHISKMKLPEMFGFLRHSLWYSSNKKEAKIYSEVIIMNTLNNILEKVKNNEMVNLKDLSSESEVKNMWSNNIIPELTKDVLSNVVVVRDFTKEYVNVVCSAAAILGIVYCQNFSLKNNPNRVLNSSEINLSLLKVLQKYKDELESNFGVMSVTRNETELKVKVLKDHNEKENSRYVKSILVELIYACAMKEDMDVAINIQMNDCLMRRDLDKSVVKDNVIKKPSKLKF